MEINEWRRQREHLLNLIFQLETGRITHWDEDEDGHLRKDTTAESLVRVKERLAGLDSRFEAGSRS